ncbi:putative bifunctional diguanylate cyclase/phosphodiesterase [Psychromarinibacter sp. S121]|uniref:putative bifunctional diguanylate cyclase/phosphodiesterase n=1 Tax=Psychromarinibacter sp. S121 TaxID=3415127 RepID=UPI003C7CC85A
MQDAIDGSASRSPGTLYPRDAAPAGSDPTDLEAVDRRAFVSAELDRMQRLVRDAVLAGLDVRDCVVALDTALHMGLGAAPSAQSCPGAGRRETVLYAALSLLGGGRAGLEPRAERSAVRRLSVDGEDLVLFAMSLHDEDSQDLGVLGLTFAPENWDDSRQVRISTMIGRLVESLLSAGTRRVALEVDYVAMNRQASQLHRLAQIDPLTKLENSASFQEKAERMLAHATGSAALIILDIDHFKSINDLYGHRFGDAYLKAIAQAILSAFPETAIIGRLGGDEFGIFLSIPTKGTSYLESLLSRCRSAVQRTTAFLGKPDLGRVSMGAATYPEQATEFDTLFELADTALYAAKDLGRSTHRIFTPEKHDMFNARAMGPLFLRAVRHGQVLPYFQPIVDLETGVCVGYEALARWDERTRGLLRPQAFAPVLKDHTCAETLTRCIVQRALDWYAATFPASASGDRPTLALNVTSFDLMNPEFVFELQTHLADRHVDWNHIVIEVTEGVVLGERKGQAFRSLGELRTRGAKVALDDFGTGYGGLRHLSDWPIDLLKIDQSFVRDLHLNPRNGAIVDAILTIAHQFGFDVVAEGVELPAQVEKLKAGGCRKGQGYLFSEPMSAKHASRCFGPFGRAAPPGQ